MSEKTKFNPSSKVANLPDGGKVYDADWKDDIDLNDFDIQKAEVVHNRKNASWNNFQAMESSDRAEEQYVPPKEVEKLDLAAVIGKAKAIKFSKNILGSYDHLEKKLLENAA